MMNFTPKAIVVTLVVIMGFVILSFSPEINSSPEFQLSELDIEILARALDVSRAKIVEREDQSLKSARDKEAQRKIKTKHKPKNAEKKHERSFPHNSDGVLLNTNIFLKEDRKKERKENSETIFTGYRKTESYEEFDTDIQNDTERELRSVVLQIRESNNTERQRRLRVSPLKVLPADQWWPTVLEPSYGKFFSDLNLTAYRDEDAAFVRAQLPRYQQRARQVSEVCSQLPKLWRRKVHIKTLVFDTRHTPNLVWCQIPKIASTSWNRNFFKLGHADDGENSTTSTYLEGIKTKHFNLHHKVFRLFPPPNTTKERNQVFTNALRFMIVRHPFVRLLSAYRGKMTRESPKPVWFHYEKMQKLIIERYRPVGSRDSSVYPTFAEFIQFVLDQTSGLEIPKDWKRAVIGCWKPYYVSCGVCVHDIQMILKIETLEEDTKFLATVAGLTQLKKEQAWLHHINNTSSGDLADDFFAQLTKKQVEELYRRYKIDFDMFGYSPQHYIDLASDN